MNRTLQLSITFAWIFSNVVSDPVDQCPVGKHQWQARQETLKCNTGSGLAYTCVKSTVGQFWEQCSHVVRVGAGKTRFTYKDT